MNKFQAIFIGVIILIIFVAFLILSGVIPVGKLQRKGGDVITLTAWGTLSSEHIKGAIGKFNSKNPTEMVLIYKEKDKESYERELIDALAGGEGPDIFFLTQDLILKHYNKTFLVPFSSFSERTFRDFFVDEAQLFLLEDGIVALPFVVDPLVLYWNKNFFSKNGFVNTPKYWDDFLNYVTNLTKRDRSGNIVESGSALGEFENVDNAKDIFSLLVLQGGNEIIERGSWDVKFDMEGTVSTNPAISALNFFTSFSNPSKSSYSWNRAMPDSRDAFVAGKLAMYFGYSGEFSDIKEANPHLNFDVAGVPQVKDSPLQATFGKIYGLAISKTSSHRATAFKAVSELTTDKDVAEELEKTSLLPPARRDVLSKGSLNPALSVFYKAAILSRSWLEPDPREVSDIFEDMIESVVTGKKSASQSVADAKALLTKEIGKIKR